MLLDGFNIKRGVAFGAIGAVAKAVSPIASVAGMVQNAFGGSKTSGGQAFSPSYGSSEQGYNAMPQYLKDIYEKQYAPAAVDYFNSPEGRTPNPIAGFNPTQRQALGMGGQNIQQIQAGLQDYMNPYDQFVTDQVRRNYAMEQNNLLGNANRIGGVGALKSSSLGTQLSLNNEAMQRALAEAKYNSYKDALGLRRQTLADMFEAGLMEQKQQQAEMSAAAQNPYTRVKNLGELLQLIPTGSTQKQIGETPMIAGREKSSMFDRVGNFANRINTMSNAGIFNNMFGR